LNRVDFGGSYDYKFIYICPRGRPRFLSISKLGTAIRISDPLVLHQVLYSQNAGSELLSRQGSAKLGFRESMVDANECRAT